jgi:SAM-dependent methyltransferase
VQDPNFKMTKPLPDYQNLDLSGEAQQAAARMEARSQEPASQEMFDRLIAPLLTVQVGTVLEFGCGTAALSRRVARAAAHAVVYASDKSAGMLQVAQQLIETEQIDNIRVQVWDVLDETTYPFPNAQFDLILSSVVVPYLDDAQIHALIKRLASRLSPGGVLTFLEQDLSTDTVNDPNAGFFRGVLTRNLREQMRSLALGLRPVLREAGLQVLPRRSFLWTDDAYGPYTRDLLERFADAAVDRGAIKPEESEAWKKTLKDLAASGDFYYGMVYHLVAGRRV